MSKPEKGQEQTEARINIGVGEAKRSTGAQGQGKEQQVDFGWMFAMIR